MCLKLSKRRKRPGVGFHVVGQIDLHAGGGSLRHMPATREGGGEEGGGGVGDGGRRVIGPPAEWGRICMSFLQD